MKYYPDASFVRRKSDFKGARKLLVQTLSHNILKLHVRNCQVSKIKTHMVETDTVRVALNLGEIPLLQVGCQRLSIKSSCTQRHTCACGQMLVKKKLARHG